MFGERIRKYRKIKNLTVKQLADIIGISQGSLSDIENNKTTPSSKTFDALFRNTDINPLWLFLGKEPIIRPQNYEEYLFNSDSKSEIKFTSVDLKDQKIIELEKEVARLKSELKKMEEDEKKDAAYLKALENKIRELELKNRELSGKVDILKELLLKKA